MSPLNLLMIFTPLSLHHSDSTLRIQAIELPRQPQNPYQTKTAAETTETITLLSKPPTFKTSNHFMLFRIGRLTASSRTQTGRD